MDYIVYLFLGFLILFVEIKRQRYFIIDLLSLFHAFFFLVYVFTPLSLIFIGDDIVSKDLIYGKYYLGKNSYTAIIIFAAYLFFLAGYYWREPRTIADNIEITFRVKLSFIMRMMPMVYVMLLAMVVIYVQGEGGLFKAINNAEFYRGGVIFAKYGFLTRLFPLNTILLFYFFYKLFLEQEKHYRHQYLFYFSLSLSLFFVMVALANSRGFLIMTLLGMYIMTAMYYRKYFVEFLLIASTFGFLIIKYGDPLFHSVPDLIDYDFATFLESFNDRMAQINAAKGSIIANFTHPILSLEVSLALSGTSIEYRYFVDFLQAFIALIPSAIFGGEDPKFVMILNTELLMGEKSSIVLPGILALFSYSLNFMGVFIGMFVYGVIGGTLSSFFINLYNKYSGALVFIYLISMTYGYFVFRGSPRNALMSLFVLLVILSVLLLLSQIKYHKKLKRQKF